MPDITEVHRNGRIRLAAVAAILLAVGLTAGWRHLLGWPALVLAADLLITGSWLLLHRGAGAARRPVAPGAGT
jgi:hypothetical protein